jgi:hypothetical protein
MFCLKLNVLDDLLGCDCTNPEAKPSLDIDDASSGSDDEDSTPKFVAASQYDGEPVSDNKLVRLLRT